MESLNELATALSKFQGEMPKIDLDATVKVTTKSGGSYDFRYATLANIMSHVRPILAKHGLSVTQGINVDVLETTLLHSSGQSIRYTIPISLDGSMQEVGSRISYLRRYSISSCLGVVADDDDDANIASGNSYQKKEKPIKPAPLSLAVETEPAKPVPVDDPKLDDALLKAELCQTVKNLENVWNEYPELHSNDQFKRTVGAIKKSILENKAK